MEPDERRPRTGRVRVGRWKLLLWHFGFDGFPTYGAAYYAHLRARFAARPHSNDPLALLTAQRIQQRIDQIEASHPKEITWNDLATLELLILKLEPDLEVRRSVWSYRNRFRTLVSAEEFAAYEASQLPDPGDPATGTMERLRADLQSLVAELHFHYDLRTQLERLRAHLSRVSALSTIGLVVLAVVLALIGLDKYRSDPMAIVETFDRKTGKVDGARSDGAMTPPDGLPAGIGVRKIPETPPPPADLRLAGRGAHVLVLDWEATGLVDGYVVERQTPGQLFTPIATVAPGLTSYTDTNVALGVLYTYQVRGIGRNAKGEAGKQGDPSGSLATSPFPPVSKDKQGMPLIIFVAVMGAIGGCLSVQRRVQDTPRSGFLLSNVIELEHGRHAIMAGPLLGGVFAAILYLVFAGGFLRGDLFPAIFPVGYVPPAGGGAIGYVPPNGFTRFEDFLHLAQPITPVDVAKVLIWAFLAGFAERLVPDTLDRIIKRNASNEPPAKLPVLPNVPNGSNGDGGGNAAAPPPKGAPADTTPLLSATPADGGQIRPTTPLVIRFKQPMHEAETVLATETGDPVEVAEQWNTDRTELTLARPDGTPWEAGRYLLLIESMMLDDEQESDARVEIHFEVD